MVRQEKLSFLAANPFYTQRFAWYVGKRCQSATITDVAKELHLDWKTVKELEKEYMQEKLNRADKILPSIIGIDEISIHKGHTYKIVVSDLEEKQPIWFGGIDRSKESMDMFYKELGTDKCAHIRLGIMDMWKPFTNSFKEHVPHGAILYDRFHVMRHLGEALDKIRKQEYFRLSGQKRSFIKGQKYNLLSHKQNLDIDGKRSLHLLLKANKRLNTAYVLKESSASYGTISPKPGHESSSTTGSSPLNGSVLSRLRNSQNLSSVTGTALLLMQNLKTKFRSASLKDLTTKSVSSSEEPMV